MKLQRNFQHLSLLLASLGLVGCESQGNRTLALAGDVMIGERVNEEAARHGDRHPWGDLLPVLKETDLVLVNLEVPLTRSAESAPKPLVFRADPERAGSLLEAGIDVCNLANNHILDGSVEGLLETLVVLEGAGIGHAGAGRDLEAARAPVIRSLGGLRIGILGATDTMPDWAAGPGRAGVHHFEVEDPGPLIELIAELRPKVDLLVLTIHWGPNLRARPSRVFQRFAHKALAAGADILHGHSAHIFQGIEVHQGKVILYDTGDLLNDYPVDPGMRNDRSFICRFSVDRAGIRELELIPVIIRDARVFRAPEEERGPMLRILRELSGEFGTKIHEQGGRILVDLHGLP